MHTSCRAIHVLAISVLALLFILYSLAYLLNTKQIDCKCGSYAGILCWPFNGVFLISQISLSVDNNKKNENENRPYQQRQSVSLQFLVVFSFLLLFFFLLFQAQINTFFCFVSVRGKRGMCVWGEKCGVEFEVVLILRVGLEKDLSQ